MAGKKCFDMAKLICQIMRVTVVQWSRSCLHVQINRVRLPVTLFSVSLYRFFPVWSLLLTLFFLLAFFSLFLLLTLSVMHLDQSLSPEFHFGKGISKALDLHNKKPCQDMSLLWNSWIFLNVNWHHDKQHTVHHKLYWFTPNTHQWPTGES